MTKKGIVKKIGKTLGIVGLFLLTFLLIAAGTLYLAMRDICYTAQSTRNTFITTLLETGQLKFLASVCLSQEEIEQVIANNSVKQFEDTEINENLIIIGGNIDDQEAGESSKIHSSDVDPDHPDVPPTEKDIEIVEIPGLTYKATLMIVRDPSRLYVATIQNSDGSWPELGWTLEKIVKAEQVIAAINGGLYHSTNNSGGYPYGVVVSRGQILRNKPRESRGLVLIGLTDKNILQIIDISKMTASECEQMIREKGIRDAVCFQEDQSSDNNHFVQLIINGKVREMTGAGSGLNPRTAIGQRSDGALLLLVTDGRGYHNHVGASASDLVDIMLRYGAVNAANLDGGSSTCMYYNGEYLQNSVTFYYSSTSWRLPCAFCVK